MTKKLSLITAVLLAPSLLNVVLQVLPNGEDLGGAGWASCSAQWNFNPSVNTSISVQPNDQQDVRIVTDGKDGAIITWLDFRNDVTQTSGDIFVQRIDKNGFAKWTANGVVLCNLATDQTAPAIVEDGNGGAIITWNDYRNLNADVYAQKIDSSGNVLWAANGIPVVVKTSAQQDSKLISDGAGGAIVVWQDSAGGTWDVYAQRISSSGTSMWTSTGAAICTAGNSQINPRIETDGSGGAILVWQDKRNGADYDIYSQRLNASGVAQWAANGVYVASWIGTQSNPKIEPDGAGGAIVAWQDKRNNADYNIYAQRINASGVNQWATNGVVVCSAANSQSAIDMVSENVANGVIISWKDSRSGAKSDIYVQKVNLDGTMAWVADGIGIATSPVTQLNPNVVTDGAGGAIVTWQDSSGGTWDVYSQKIDGNGIVQWTSGGVAVGIAADNQTSPKNISDGAGGCIYAWQDKRNTLNFDIYAHRILSNGISASVNELGVQSSMFQVYPNPSDGMFNVQCLMANGNTSTINHQPLTIAIHNIFGEKVFQSHFSLLTSHFSLDVPSGLYFYQITSESKQLTVNHVISTGKFMITK